MNKVILNVCLVLFVATVYTSDAQEHGDGSGIPKADVRDIDCTKRPPFVNPQKCCPVPIFTTEELRKKCFQTRGHGGRHSHHAGGQSRYRRGHGRFQHNNFRALQYRRNNYWGCVLNETGILSDDILNETALKQHLQLIFANDERLLPVMEQAFHVCFDHREELQEFAGRHSHCSHAKPHHHRRRGHRHHPQTHSHPHHHQSRRHHPEHRSNHTNARHLMGCVFRETFVNCLPELWNNTELCGAKRDYLVACKRFKQEEVVVFSEPHEDLNAAAAGPRQPAVIERISDDGVNDDGAAEQLSEEYIHQDLLSEEHHTELNEISDEDENLEIDLRTSEKSNIE